MKNRKVAIVLALMALVAFPVKAQDFAVRLSSGDSLFFEITDAQRLQVTVVPPSDDGTDYYKGHQKISGVLVIPATVSHEGQTYTVTAIGERAFSGCTEIRMVSIPPTVTAIGSYAFYGCVGIGDPVVIGEDVTRVGLSAFYGCAQLPAVVFKARRCMFMGGSLATAVFGNCGGLTKVTIGEEVTRIPDYAFCGADGLSNTVVLPESLEYIGEYAFSFCSKMRGEVVIPDGVTTIGECAYNQCHAITALTLGAAVDTIGSRAFYKCIGLRTVTVRTTTPPRMEGSTFSGFSKRPSVSIPCVSKTLYEKDATWSELGAFKTHGSCSFTVEADVVSAAEAMVLGSGSYKYGDSVTLVVAPAAGYAFVGWSDGNKENPRRFIARDDLKVSALTEGERLKVEGERLKVKGERLKVEGERLKVKGERLKEIIYRVDTVFSEGMKVIHDTVDIFTTSQPVDASGETIAFDSAQKRVVWNFSEGERMLTLMVFNASGECIYRTDNVNGKLKMQRFPTGNYFVRVETVRRTLNYRFFMNNE